GGLARGGRHLLFGPTDHRALRVGSEAGALGFARRKRKAREQRDEAGTSHQQALDHTVRRLAMFVCTKNGLTRDRRPSDATSPAANSPPALAPLTRPGVAGPERRARKRIGSSKAAEAQDRLIALVKRRITAVVADAFTGIGRAPASAGPRRLAPSRARPALGVGVGEQQSCYCDTEQNK